MPVYVDKDHSCILLLIDYITITTKRLIDPAIMHYSQIREKGNMHEKEQYSFLFLSFLLKTK
jgi:hypothetical protein